MCLGHGRVITIIKMSMSGIKNTVSANLTSTSHNSLSETFGGILN